MTEGEFKEFQKRIGWGEEFNFYYKDEEYWISQNPNRFHLTKVKGAITQTFETADQLFQNGRIMGNLLKEIYEEIDW
jgi:hypothetical protein